VDRKEAASACICPMCPTFVDCGEELGFCFMEAGASKCIRSELGCICPGCSVQEQMKFHHMFYCTRGSDKAQIKP